ncbi:hypothetical protein ACLOJK_016309 [Asimina triloba]
MRLSLPDHQSNSVEDDEKSQAASKSMELIAAKGYVVHPRPALNLHTDAGADVRSSLALASSTLQRCIERWGGGPCLLHGKAMHALAIRLLPCQYRGPLIYSNLLHFYCKAGMPWHAHRVFNEMPVKDLMAWTVLIGAFARCGLFSEALDLFGEMFVDHKPNSFSVSVVLGCFAALGAVREGRQIHGYMIKNIEAEDTCSESSLVDFYAKLGLLSEARAVFDGMTERDVISWTIMIRAYANALGCEDEVLGLFGHMRSSGIEPTRHTLTAILGCVCPELGKQLHAFVLKRNWGSDAFLGSAFIDLYAKSGDFHWAHIVFDRILKKDAVCFNGLISAHGRFGNGEHAICLFTEMALAGFAANQSTYVGMLGGCAEMGSMSFAEQLHAHLITRGFIEDEVIRGVIVDTYAKCGSLEAARTNFDEMKGTKNVAAWNSMIGGYGKHGHGMEALQLFYLMERASVMPDYITFTCLLSACSHSGLVDEGWRLFYLMGDGYKIQALNEHYGCMVDLLSRAGMIQEAYKFIRRMPFEAGPSIWTALLGGCKEWRNAEVGEIAARRLFELEPGSSAAYVALANIYAASGRWQDVSRIRELMDGQGIRKDPGCSWIEIDSRTHKFKSGEKIHHPRLQDTCKRLNACILDSPVL